MENPFNGKISVDEFHSILLTMITNKFGITMEEITFACNIYIEEKRKIDLMMNEEGGFHA